MEKDNLFRELDTLSKIQGEEIIDKQKHIYDILNKLDSLQYKDLRE
jgi:hypothetical protein